MNDMEDWHLNRDADPNCECCLGDGLQADGETPCPCLRDRSSARGPRHHYRVGFAAGRAAAIRGMTVAEAARVIIEAEGRRDAAVVDAYVQACAWLSDDPAGEEITNEIIAGFLRVLSGVE